MDSEILMIKLWRTVINEKRVCYFFFPFPLAQISYFMCLRLLKKKYFLVYNFIHKIKHDRFASSGLASNFVYVGVCVI